VDSGRRVVARLRPKRHSILSLLCSCFCIPRLLPQEVVISQSRIYARVGQNVSGIVWKINHDRVKNIIYNIIIYYAYVLAPRRSAIRKSYSTAVLISCFRLITKTVDETQIANSPTNDLNPRHLSGALRVLKSRGLTYQS